MPVQYWASHRGRYVYVRYRHGWLSVDVDGETVVETQIGGQWDGAWTDEETNVYLELIDAGLHEERLAALELPTLSEARRSALHRKGSLPLRAVGLRCGKRQSDTPLPLNRHERKRAVRAGEH